MNENRSTPVIDLGTETKPTKICKKKDHWGVCVARSSKVRSDALLFFLSYSVKQPGWYSTCMSSALFQYPYTLFAKDDKHSLNTSIRLIICLLELNEIGDYFCNCTWLVTLQLYSVTTIDQPPECIPVLAPIMNPTFQMVFAPVST